jgi:hypothetical protein
MIQSRFGTQGNFELVVPTTGGGLAHHWRNNDDPAMPWYGPYPFGAGSNYSEVTLTQSNFADPGNLEVVAESADTLESFWRDSGPSFTWSGPLHDRNRRLEQATYRRHQCGISYPW